MLSFWQCFKGFLHQHVGQYLTRFGVNAQMTHMMSCDLQDLSGRPHLSFDLQIPTERIGNYDTQLVEHFFQSVVNTSGMTLHIRCAA